MHLEWWSVLPFAGMLACIAVLPLIPATAHWWEKHSSQLIVAVGLGVPVAAWIGPATIDTVGDLGRAGCPRLDAMCPGFVSDCLETLEEINQLNRETFTTAGGGGFHCVPWGNDSDGAIATLAEQARNVLAGWI